LNNVQTDTFNDANEPDRSSARANRVMFPNWSKITMRCYGRRGTVRI